MGKKKIHFEEPSQAWERQDAESGVEFEVFARYRDMGPGRSLARLSDEVGKHISLIARWARKYRWSSRVNAYDRWCDKVRLDKARKEMEEMGERHAQIAMLAQSKVLQALQSMKSESLPPQTVVSMFDVAVRVERLARGMATQSTEVTGKGGAPLEIGEAHDRLKDLIRRAKLGAG